MKTASRRQRQVASRRASQQVWTLGWAETKPNELRFARCKHPQTHTVVETGGSEVRYPLCNQMQQWNSESDLEGTQRVEWGAWLVQAVVAVACAKSTHFACWNLIPAEDRWLVSTAARKSGRWCAARGPNRWWAAAKRVLVMETVPSGGGDWATIDDDESNRASGDAAALQHFDANSPLITLLQHGEAAALLTAHGTPKPTLWLHQW